jgi:threonine/homoserine/homoserine lactone efflux protein
MGIENFYTFSITALLFIMTPGIDTIFVLNKSIVQGKKAGIYSTLGINSGVLIHTIFAALGLSVIVAQSAIAFTVIKYLGAAYLVYLGIAKLFAQEEIIKKADDDLPEVKGSKNFISGFITNTLNPKVALFFLAFFPQFIQADQIDNPLPFILLGITYAGIGTLWFLTLTFFAGTFSKKIAEYPKANLWLNKSSAVVFLLMGLKIALTKK